MRGTIARTATQSGRPSGHRRGLETRGDRRCLIEKRLGAVVVDHHVLLTEDDALDAGDELLLGLGELRVATGDQDGLGVAQRLAEGGQPVLAQGPSGTDDVGDGIGHTELDGDLDRAVEPDDVGGDAAAGEVVTHQVGVRGRDALAGEVGDIPLLVGGCRVAEGRRAEAHRELLVDLGPRVAGEVASGDTEVQAPRPDVDGDVLGAQEEELDVVVVVENRQVLGVTSFAVAGLGEDGRRGFGERTLVGYGHSQHLDVLFVGLRSAEQEVVVCEAGSTGHRCRYTSSSFSPRLIIITCSQ